jgi:ABC-type transporter Mla MlaB component
VRDSGVLDERDPLTSADHVCWVYDDPASFVDAAQRYLSVGLDRRERLLCVGEGLAADLRAAGEPFGSLDALVARGALRFDTLDAAYAESGSLDAADQRAFYDAAVRAARAAGFTGLRVVAEVTPLARAAPARAGLVEWEHLADEFIASGSGMVALCAYRRRALCARAVADLTAVHPLVHAPQDPPSFRIWFDGPRVVLAGTVDTFAADRLARILAASPVGGPTAVLDLSRLEVADVAGCRALAEWARALHGRGVGLEVVHAPRSVLRIWRVLGMGGSTPVTFAAAL